MKKKLLIFIIILVTFGLIPVSATDTTRRSPSGIVADGYDTLLVTDLYNKVIWSKSGDSWTVYAGSHKERLSSGIAVGGFTDGNANDALFASPWAIAPFLGGYAVTDSQNNAVRLIVNGRVRTAAGNENAGWRNGIGTAAQFNNPTGLVSDGNGNLFIADTGNHSIRMLDKNGYVTTIVGGNEGCADGSSSSAKLREPTGLAYANGILYIADSGNHRICKWENGTLTTIAGNSFGHTIEGSYADGSIASSKFNNPQGIAVASNGVIYVSDTGNGIVRAISDRQVSTVFNQEISQSLLYPTSPRGIIMRDNIPYAADTFSGNIYACSKPIDIPVNSNTPIDTPSTPVPQTYTYDFVMHTVCRAETLWGLSKRYGCTISDIAKLNHISHINYIFVGQLLKIPM